MTHRRRLNLNPGDSDGCKHDAADTVPGTWRDLLRIHGRCGQRTLWLNSTNAPESCSKTLIERYIADGQLIGSRALSKRSTGRTLSSATIRNAASDPKRRVYFGARILRWAGFHPTRLLRFVCSINLLRQPSAPCTAPTARTGERFQPDQPQRLITGLNLLSRTTLCRRSRPATTRSRAHSPDRTNLCRCRNHAFAGSSVTNSAAMFR